MTIVNVLSSELIKIKRTLFHVVVAAIPIMIPSCIIFYILLQSVETIEEIKVYQYFFELTGIALPIIISLLVGIQANEEEKANQFINILSNSISRTYVYTGKLLFIILHLILSLFISTFVLILGMTYILKIEEISYLLFLQGTSLLVLGMLALIPIYFFASFCFGFGSSLALGGVGFLTAAIVGGTMLGDAIWIYIPWAWSIRLTQVPILRLLSSSIEVSLIQQSLLAFGGFLILSLFVYFWFLRWEGRQAYE